MSQTYDNIFHYASFLNQNIIREITKTSFDQIRDFYFTLND
jgi:hypothetical protein